MKTLDEIALDEKEFETDKSSKYHDYMRRYEPFLESLRPAHIRLLEIGVNMGASILAWLKYFPNAHVFGVDIEPRTRPNHDRYTFVRGDQSKPDFWERFTQDHPGKFDVIIDDGGHTSGQIITSFTMHWPHVVHGGVYAIEDLACAYTPDCLTPGFINHMDFLLGLMHHINQGHLEIDSLTFSKELAIFRKQA